MKKVLIVHHNDLDGVGAAAIVANALSKGDIIETTFVPYYYTDASAKDVNDALLKAANDGSDVYIVDISISSENIDKIDNIYKISANRLVWIDHHTSSVTWMNSTYNTEKELHCNCIVNPRRSGAYHAWKYMHGYKKGTKIPAFVSLIDDYDRYKLTEINSQYLNAAFYAIDEMRDPKSMFWKELCDPTSIMHTHVLNTLIEKGKIIKDYLESTYRSARKTRLYNISVRIKSTNPKHEPLEYNALCINHAGSPDVFGDQIKRDDIDLCIAWYTTNKGATKYSFRSSHNWVRCDIISKYLGGGGHKLSAGTTMEIPTEPIEDPNLKNAQPPLKDGKMEIVVSSEDFSILKKCFRKKSVAE